MAEHQGGCCPPGSEPELASNYKPKGKTEKVGDLDLYYLGSGDKGIIVVNDIFGVDGGRTKLITDQCADAGFFAVLPDFLRGEKWSEQKGFGPELFE